MTLAFFYLMAATVLVGGLGVVLIRNTVYAALFLIVSLLGVAGIYILLSVEFLALVQVLIYAGAITVLFIFVLMITRVSEFGSEQLSGGQTPLAAVAALGLLAAFVVMWTQTDWPRDIDQLTVIPFATIASELFQRWVVPFEILSGVLLVALVGAIVIAMREPEEA